ncbi:MAG: sensor histidine kinase [Bradyrhizobium sp.]|uniref:sensor histidine kinase n=1 Tax=Bradyrhizobium sp. TaxID=376 RepID=UPI0025B86F75|nr:sensor histidine kinase [Bradyrhizobium sp.]MBI5263754.1 sensor histidine kinase [Bradyrhizobium sp.]
MPKLSLPVRLTLLVAGTTLPLILFAGSIVLHDYQVARNEATGRVLDTVRSVRLVVDAEVQRMTGGLQVLALSRSFRDGSFDEFRRGASGFLAQYGEGGLLVVTDREGRELFSSQTENKDRPSGDNRKVVQKVFASKAPQYSDLFMDAVSNRLILTIEVPVMRDGEVLYGISFSPPMSMFQELIEKQRPDQRWILALLDGKGIVFARAPNLNEMFGKRATPSIYDYMFQKPEATLTTVSLEGIPLTGAYARSTLTGWTVAAGIAESSLIAPLWRNLAITSLIGGILLLTGLGFALRMAATIARGEMLHGLLIEELNHRVKNTMALLQAIAVQTFRSAKREEREKFEGRLVALAGAHNLLSEEMWKGSDLKDVLKRVLQPLLSNSDRIRMSGPDVPLSSRLAVVMSMIVHEIATNAAKYGALSNDVGTVRVDWELMTDSPKPKLRLIWTETGGPPVVAPVHRGFGSRLIERSARDQLGGEAIVDFLPCGVVYTLTCTLEDAR